MPDFTKSIIVEEENLRFLFSKIYVPTGVKFFVTVFIKNAVTSFDVQQDKKGDWKIVHPAPDWLTTVEPELVSAIKSSLMISVEK